MIVTLFTDGSSVHGNPGDAAYAYVIMKDSEIKDALGVPLGHGTNNEGELTACLKGLEACLPFVDKDDTVLLVSDSKYILNGIADISRYTSSLSRPNRDLWLKLSAVLRRLGERGGVLKTFWVRGHDRNSGNILCDKLAQTAARTQQIQRVSK